MKKEEKVKEKLKDLNDLLKERLITYQFIKRGKNKGQIKIIKEKRMNKMYESFYKNKTDNKQMCTMKEKVLKSKYKLKDRSL